MNRSTPWIATAILAVASAATAHADPITGTISVSGNDTFDSSQITFLSMPGSNVPTGGVDQASGTLAVFAPVVAGGLQTEYQANLTSFAFGSAAGTTLFSVSNGAISASYTITNLLTQTIGSDSNGPTLSLSGWGYFNETGFDQTEGRFSLTSSTSGITGFQIVSNVAAAPEPGSLVLLGTGAVGMVSGLVRRRRLA